MKTLFPFHPATTLIDSFRVSSSCWRLRLLASLFAGLLLSVCPVPRLVAAEPAPGFYRSNAIGMALERIESPDAAPDGEYVLEVREERGVDNDGEGERITTEQQLLREGERVSRTHSERVDGVVRGERQWEGDELVSERVFDESGMPELEITYEAGEVVERLRFVWRGNRLLERIHESVDGDELFREKYFYRDDGQVRRVERSFSDGGRGVSEFLYSGLLLIEEWHERDRVSLLVRYDRAGRLALSEERIDGETVLVEHLTYPPSDISRNTPPLRSERIEPERDTRTVTEYDSEGLARSERRIAGERTELEREFEYANGRLSREVRRDASGEEIRTYEYDGEDNLVLEERRGNGELRRRIRYANGEAVEERYIDGRLALIIERVDERRVREQVIQDGEVVRERTF